MRHLETSQQSKKESLENEKRIASDSLSLTHHLLCLLWYLKGGGEVSVLFARERCEDDVGVGR